MKIGQVVKFRKEILDIAKPNTPIKEVVDLFKNEKMIVTDMDEFDFVKINNKNEFINSIWLEEIQ